MPKSCRSTREKIIPGLDYCCINGSWISARTSLYKQLMQQSSIPPLTPQQRDTLAIKLRLYCRYALNLQRCSIRDAKQGKTEKALMRSQEIMRLYTVCEQIENQLNLKQHHEIPNPKNQD